MTHGRNTFIVGKERFTNVHIDMDTFDKLPAVVREALREAVYEFSSEDAMNLISVIRDHLTEGDWSPPTSFVYRETADHIRMNDSAALKVALAENIYAEPLFQRPSVPSIIDRYMGAC